MTRTETASPSNILALALLALLNLMSGPAPAQSKTLTPIELLTGGKYLQAGKCAELSTGLFDWPAKYLKQCTYEVEDHLADGSTRKRKGLVVLANPTPQRALSWVVSACTIVVPDAEETCVQIMTEYIRGASGAQFPVAGLVWEDLYCGKHGNCVYNKKKQPIGDGVYEGYVFRNGVTVRVEGYANGTETPASDLEALAYTQVVTGVKAGYARISSTSREEFRRYTGRSDIPSGNSAEDAIAWSDIVGTVFREALSSKRNPLIEASVCAKYGFPETCNPQ